jgi:hypothetical protein
VYILNKQSRTVENSEANNSEVINR